MSHGNYPILKILEYLPDDLSGMEVLDAGVGAGEGGFYIRQYVNRPWSRKRSGTPVYLVGVDKVQENIDRLEGLHIYDKLILADLLEFDFDGLPRRPRVSICLETLEHIEKLDSLSLLRSLVRVSDVVLVSMPYRERIPRVVEDMGVPAYRHRSSWTREDLKIYGFETYVDDFYNISPRLAPLYNLIRRVLGRTVKRELIGVWYRGGGLSE